MIRVAVIGAGHWGPNLISNFHVHERSQVLWVVDRDDTRLEAVRARFPGVETSGRVEPALDDPRVDAVIVATPTSTHFDVTRAALEAGKHVLVEKPLAHSVETAEALRELAERSRRVLMVGHIFVYNAAAQRAKEYLVEGELGRIHIVAHVVDLDVEEL